MAMDLADLSRFARTFQAGEIIFAEYEPGDTFYLIRSGRVELVKIMGDIEKTLDVLQPSEMFGEMSMLDNSPRSATAIALDTVEALEFNRENFNVLMTGNPQIALKLIKLFTKRIYEAKRRSMVLMLKDPQARVADVFLMLNETQTNLDRSGDAREFNITIDDIAHWAGMSSTQTREVMNRFLAQQRVAIYPDRIEVKNINAFARFVDARRRK
jgi:CRP-like cAMP-binding protein